MLLRSHQILIIKYAHVCHEDGELNCIYIQYIHTKVMPISVVNSLTLPDGRVPTKCPESLAPV